MMAKCRFCEKETDGRRLCGDCRVEWKKIRIKAYDMTVNEIGEYNYNNRKQFRKRLIEIEKELGQL